jgi:hypothetical protein
LPKWYRWSREHPLPKEHIVSIEHRGIGLDGEKDCLLQYLVKKPRKGIAIKTYDFSTILDLHLVVENRFYEEVSLRLEQDLDLPATTALKVSGNLPALTYTFPDCLL